MRRIALIAGKVAVYHATTGGILPTTIHRERFPSASTVGGSRPARVSSGPRRLFPQPGGPFESQGTPTGRDVGCQRRRFPQKRSKAVSRSTVPARETDGTNHLHRGIPDASVAKTLKIVFRMSDDIPC